MKTLCAVLLLSLSAVAQNTNCTATNWPATNQTQIDCDNGKSATVTSYPLASPPPAQPMPLPALAIQPPVMNTNLMMMVMQARSNRPPSDRQVRKFCKKHSGGSWTKRNWQGIVVAEGSCQ